MIAVSALTLSRGERVRRPATLMSCDVRVAVLVWRSLSSVSARSSSALACAAGVCNSCRRLCTCTLRMLIGVRNEAGEIYRLIGAAKLNSFMNAVEELIDLGLVVALDHKGHGLGEFEHRAAVQGHELLAEERKGHLRL